jgi:neutral ceramidase
LEYDEEPMGSSFGSIIRDTKESYAKGEQAELVVWSGNPRNDFKTGNNYLSVEHREGDQWVPIANDADWETKIRWLQASPDGKLPTQEKPKTASLFPSRAKPSLAAHQAVLTWDIPADLPAGEYRIVHYGVYKPKGESVRNFTAASRTFAVQ